MHVIMAPAADACHFCGSVGTVVRGRSIVIRQGGAEERALRQAEA